MSISETHLRQCTISNLLLDDIYQDSPPKLLHSNVLGGAGIYAALGARIFREQDVNEQSGGKSVGVIVHEGCDFPVDAKVELESWHLSSVFIKTPQRLTTRGKNIYSKEGVRNFEFITPKIQYAFLTSILHSLDQLGNLETCSKSLCTQIMLLYHLK